jgi:hypothetical protein
MKATMQITREEAIIGNDIMRYLAEAPPVMSYPERTEKMVFFMANHALRWTTSHTRLRSLVLEALLRHVKNHGADRFILCQNEFNEILDPKTNLIRRPPLNGFRFLCPSWNELWDSFSGTIA